MKLLQRKWTEDKGWLTISDNLGAYKRFAQLVLIFGSTDALKNKELYKDIKEEFSDAKIAGCATAGEICGDDLLNDSVVLTAIYFEYSTIETSAIFLDQYPGFNLKQIAQELIEAIPITDLVHVFVLSDGIEINGSELVKGFRTVVPEGISVTGGLSGDYYRFLEAPVVADVMACKNTIMVIGFYGKNLTIGTSSRAGWGEFGGEKQITKSKGNKLYTLDGESALPFYERYLGDSFKEVPASSIHFPISIKRVGDDNWMTRTIIGIDREEGSLTFAGDVPMGCTARLMKTETQLLIESSKQAAMDIKKRLGHPDLAILISCFGRRGVMVKDTSKELLAVKNVFGDTTVITGFYSYGEIAPFKGGTTFELHNQTMTITAISENRP